MKTIPIRVFIQPIEFEINIDVHSNDSIEKVTSQVQELIENFIRINASYLASHRVHKLETNWAAIDEARQG